MEHRLAGTAEQVETALSALFDGGPTAPSSAGPSVPERLQDAMRHAVLGGGKRFRPFLVIESAALFDVAAHEAMAAALAVELIHCYSLVHDDLPAMDNDLLRRGQPTVWRAFDDWTAILAGDGLQALAFEIIADSAAPPQVRSDLVAMLARASGAAGMVGGQARDLAAERCDAANGGGDLDLAAIRQLQAMKTGALIRFSCEAGAVLGGGNPDERAALRRYGDRLGWAFQIADDLLDVEGDAAAVGKAVGKDAEAGKATLVSLMGLDAARAALAEARDEAVAALDMFGAKADVLRSAAEFVVNRRR